MKKEFHLMRIIYTPLIFFLLTGCVTLNSVKRDLQKVDYSDGIDEKEAIAIARMSMINSKLHEDYHLWTATTYDFSGYWKVVFFSLYFNKHECILVVEKSTGDLLAFFEAADIEVAVFDESQVQAAVEAYGRYGKGLNPNARLNLGDCAAYALASSFNVALLFKGGDFRATDIQSAL